MCGYGSIGTATGRGGPNRGIAAKHWDLAMDEKTFRPATIDAHVRLGMAQDALIRELADEIGDYATDEEFERAEVVSDIVKRARMIVAIADCFEKL